MILPDFGFHCFFPFVLPINLFLTRAVKCTVVNNKKQKKTTTTTTTTKKQRRKSHAPRSIIGVYGRVDMLFNKTP